MTGRDWVLADAFDRAAPTYDAMVALSPGYHDQLRTAAEALVGRLPSPAATARVRWSSTSAAGRAPRRAPCSTRGPRAAGAPAALDVTGVDASEGMVAQARAKAWPAGVGLVVSDAVAHLRGAARRLGRRGARRVPAAQRPGPAGPRRRGGPGAAARRGARAPRLLGGRQPACPGDLGGGLPRRHHPARVRSSAPTCRCTGTSTRACATSTRWTQVCRPDAVGRAGRRAAPLLPRVAGRPGPHRRRGASLVSPLRRTSPVASGSGRAAPSSTSPPPRGATPRTGHRASATSSSSGAASPA